MNTRAVRAIVLKDLMVVTQSRAVMLPLVIVPLIMLVALPLFASLAPNFLNLPGMSNVNELLERLPAGLQETLAPYTPEQQVVVVMIVYLFAAIYLIVPMMVASVIAADSFAGEKERKTLEALLYSPTTDLELVTAKLLSGWLPAIGVALGGFVVYSVVANIAAWPVMGQIFFPNVMWVVLALWVAPAVAGLGLAATVLVSTRVKSFQEAYQLGGVVVLPLVALIVSQAAGVVYLSTTFVLLLGLIVWLLDGVLLWFAVKTFRRGEIVAQL